MARLSKKFIKLGISTVDELNSRDLPANYTAVNYTPTQVSIEGVDKVSSHLKGIDNQFGNYISPPLTTTAVSNSILTLTLSSTPRQVLTGTVAGQRINLGNATTYINGRTFNIFNNSSTLIALQNNGSVFLDYIYLGEMVECILIDNTTSNGVWEINKHRHTELNTLFKFDDMIGATTGYDMNWAIGTASSGTSTAQANELDHIGIHRLSITTNNGSTARIQLNNTYRNFQPVVIEGMIRLNAVQSVSRIVFGLTTTNTLPTTPTAAAYFYSDNTLTVWQGRTVNASTSTNTSTGINITTGTWYRMTMVVNTGRVDFYINGTLVASNTTNIPSNTQALIPLFGLIKTSAGGTALSADIDYFLMNTSLVR